MESPKWMFFCTNSKRPLTPPPFLEITLYHVPAKYFNLNIFLQIFIPSPLKMGGIPTGGQLNIGAMMVTPDSRYSLVIVTNINLK